MRRPPARGPLALLPMDDRPVNLDDVELLAREHGVELLLPPRPLLGHRSRPGDSDALAAWLLRVAPDAGGFVISLDQLLYGGLIASRSAAPTGAAPTGVTPTGVTPTDEPTARRRLATLAALRRARPDAPVLAFLVLPRTTSTVRTSADLTAWQHALEAGAPPPERLRNLALALAALDEVAAGNLDWLSILQEDTSPSAAPRTEHEQIAAAIAAAGLRDRCVLAAGADEGARVLVARLARSLAARLASPDATPLATRPAPPLATPADLGVRVRFSSQAGADRVAPYEDRPLRATLAGQLRALGAREVGEGASPAAAIELWVHAPDQPGVDLCMRHEPPPPAPETAPFLEALRARLREPGRPVVVLADTAHANGADPALLGLLDDELVAGLDGFAAWNTAANTLGCALAQGVLAATAPTTSPAAAAPAADDDAQPAASLAGTDIAQSDAVLPAVPAPAAPPSPPHRPRPFVLRRLADDGLYQTRVRPALAATAAAMGADPWCLGGPARLELERLASRALADLQPRLAAAAATSLAAPTGAPGTAGPSAPAPASPTLPPFAVELPWERLFEARLRPLVPSPLHSMPRRDDVDVLVAGGGISGVTAALAAARLGVRVTLVEESSMLGGSATRSLVTPWMGFHSAPDVPAVAGIAQEIVDALVALGASPGHVTDPIGTAVTVTPFEPDALRMLLPRLVAAAGVEILLHTRVVAEAGGISLLVHGPGGHRVLSAPVVVDATGDAVVAHLLGAATVHGRPGDGATQPATLMIRLAGVDADQLARAQAADPADVVLSDEARGLLPRMTWPAVAGFFSLVARAQADGIMGDFRDRVLAFGLPGGDVVVNMTRVTGLDLLDGGDRTRAELRAQEQAAQVIAFLRSRVPGFAGARLVGLGSALGIRETRHLVGRRTLTVDDILAGRRDGSSVARGCFPLDLHAPDGAGMSIRHAPPGSWYGIPWGCLLPADGPPGLLVTGRAISATHEASASARLAPTCMALGQAAGTGAALAVRRRCPPAGLDPVDLRRELAAEGALV